MMLLAGLEDLTEENLTKVFQEHFDSRDLSVTVKEGAREFTGVNDHLMSDVRKLKLKMKGAGEQDEELSLVVKTTPQKGFLRFIHCAYRPLLSEVMWYRQALPSLAVHYPELTSITPICYYGSSNFLKDCQAEDCWESKCGSGRCGLLFKMIHRKDEAGLLLLEDITKGSDPRFLLDKTQMLSLNQVLAAVKALATFHGVWWAWLRKEAKTEDGKLMLADVNEVYSKGKRLSERKSERNVNMMRALVKMAEEHSNKDLSCR